MGYFDKLETDAPKRPANAARYWRNHCQNLLEIGLPKPTTKQGACLRVIQEFISREGQPPTYREIGERMNATPQAVACYLKALTERGYIKRVPGQARSISVHEFPT